MDDAPFQERFERIEELLAAIEQHGNPVVRAAALDLVRTLLEVQRAGFAEVLEQLAQHGATGQTIQNALLQSPLVSRLLLLHDLHPVDLPTRLRQALDEAQPWLEARGALVQLEQASAELVRLKVRGGAEVHAALEQALLEAAPEVLRIELVDADTPRLRPLPMVRP